LETKYANLSFTYRKVNKMNSLSTDVLIIGSGGAGLRAAIEARRYGANVLVISKSQMGLASCTASAMGAFRVSRGEKAIEKHFQETLETGRFLNNPALVKILVTEAWPAIRELDEFGVELLVEKDKASITTDKPPAGTTLSKALSRYASSLGINVLEKTIAFDMLVYGNKCFGALVLKVDTGEIIAISAKAVVLATGGYSRLYIRNDNPPTITGDGLISAFQAGAELQDLEFIQFQPMFIDTEVPRMPILDWLIEATKNLVPNGPLVNKRGERFLDKYGLLKQKILRDNLIIAIEREILEEDEDSVIFDLTQLNPKEIEEAFDSKFCRHTIRPFKQILSARKLRIVSSAHYTMGGIRINENCETKVEGLYAVGEVASGIHGANRLGGNALTEIIVFGRIAGQQAAEYTKHAKSVQVRQKYIKEGIKTLQEFRGKSKSKRINPSLVKQNVKSVVSKFCKPIRSRKGLTYALEELKHIEKEVSFMFAGNSAQLKEAIEAKFMLTLAKLVVNSALAREESRGSHFRIDHPKSDDEKWLKNILLTKEDNKVRIAYMPVKNKET